ncbi:MAG: UvrD-helicase domain-containing protein, partial [Burkholderiaceae bacterium]|nr:UvrD-helicase domain-containing protein [Burkholderiaceae bacterium]
GLNLAQSDAVNHLHGPCLVLAGAGSGKTRVITHKIARLIQTGVPPARIAAITFTNKAASEMRERARQLIGKAASEVLICTFHALGVRILREDGVALGIKPRFSILDSDDALSLLKDVAPTTDAQLARQWQWVISRWKNAGLGADAAQAQAASASEREAAQIMQRYQERLNACQSVDFDDLIGLPLRLLHNQSDIARKWQQKIAYFLVDEYQDTNAAQYALMKALVGAPGHFTAVGDDDQSIYGWRGATLDNLRSLPQDFPGIRVIKLEQNYRSTSAILQAANNVIGPNPKLFPKRLYSELGQGEPVRILICDNEQHEAERAVARLQSLRAESAHKQWRDFAILYRANHLAKPFEQALRRAQIPYKVSGGQSFFDRAEIKDLCAWLRLCVNENDDAAFLRAITTPKRGIGQQTLSQLASFAANARLSLFGALFAGSLQAALSARAVALLHDFGRQIDALHNRARHTTGAAAVRALLDAWLQDIGYERHLRDAESSAPLAAARWNNVLEFCDWIAQRCDAGQHEASDGAHPPGQPQTLLQVAQTISLITTLGERQQDQNVVTLSTLHAAKGLEWPHVILTGINEGVLPFRADAATSARDKQERVEEERRLMYVGITRARQTLTVSWARRRKQGREFVAAQPSRFIAEMALQQTPAPREDPREKLKALRAEFARKAQEAAAQAARKTASEEPDGKN